MALVCVCYHCDKQTLSLVYVALVFYSVMVWFVYSRSVVVYSLFGHSLLCSGSSSPGARTSVLRF